MRLQREMAGVEQMHLGARHLLLQIVDPLEREEWVVLPPDDQHRRLAFGEVALPGRICREIALIIVQQPKLDLAIARPIQPGLIHRPGIGREPLGPRGAMDVLEARRLRLQQVSEGLLGLGIALAPERRHRRSHIRAPALGIGDRVLHDQPAHALRAAQCQAEPDRAAIVLQIERIALQPEPVDQRFHHIGEAVETIIKLGRRRRAAMAEAGIVRRDHPVLPGQAGNQVAKHVRGRWEAVQQQERRRILRPGLAIEDLGAGDRGGAEMGRNGLGSCHGRHGENSSGKGDGGKAAEGAGHCERRNPYFYISTVSLDLTPVNR
ncbi:hypothetical protein BOSE62_30567 [Bosea sp. 62]|nr:hypothetical protein BOSE46_130010 [Bosea sp. 46]CAD5265548.1 hypothetical protein BOSE21B_111039 [Bosea sp. 21B]CAD5274222.1 hypothetical protein BOSE7B_40112 [Bosea sp. 7B]VVT56751.1 hypothetical protein BOS5A_170112 [Bosea sp. EC-HK365B]VXB75964.1 hypothetical protein BOSE29B_120168 [Bosea sp. 29B]VXC14341.1 hypothetical protein BOSE125_180020 [Bosea sp. 125]VXC26155.1 hypothetical protein BOSE62_30567 [Bosea sp. 62]VXC74257.1 hypothetical protein BOSE127_40353 [Bosea sp. 127]